MIDVFSYLDYRQLLSDLYDDRKKQEPGLSYRSLAKKVGFNSAGFFTNILRGKRGISGQIIEKFAKFFKLKIKERQYFEYLVHANQAKNQTQKKHFLDLALTLKKVKFKVKDVEAHKFYSKWYYTALRELLAIYPFKGEDYRILARSLFPPVTPREAKRAIEYLEKAGFIKKNKSGTYYQKDPFISSSQEIAHTALAEFHMEMAELAKTAIDKCPEPRRSISTLTLGLSEEGFKEVVQRIRTFRKDLMELASKEEVKDRVYHMNFHVFPLSKKWTEHRP